jgi:hypothetical protein
MVQQICRLGGKICTRLTFLGEIMNLTNTDTPDEFILEQSLQSFFRPVDPRPIFVDRLKGRLFTEPRVQLYAQKPMTLWLIIAGGLVIGSLLILLLRKPRGNQS